MSHQIDDLVLLLRDGRYEDAAREARERLNSFPESAELLNVHGLALLQLGQLAKSISVFKQAVKANPNFAPAYSNLGTCYRELGEMSHAIHCLQHAVKLTPEDYVSHFNLGNSYSVTGDIDAAERHYNKALRINPGLLAANLNLAAAKMRTGDYDSALELVERVLKKNATLTEFLALKADIMERQNKLDAAEEALSSLSPQAQSHHDVLIVSARLDIRRKEFERARHKLEKILSQKNQITQELEAESSYLLGLCFDRLGEPDKAINACISANQVIAQSSQAHNCDKHLFRELIADLGAAFAEAEPSIWNTCKLENELAPVFLVGFPRSGTTLLNNIFSSHHKIDALDEKPTTVKLLNSLSKIDDERPHFPHLSDEQREKLQNEYAKYCRLYGAYKGDGIILDKMPLNYVHAAQLKLIFPKAKFLFCVRHPCDAVLSSFMQHFLPNNAVSNFFSIRDTAYIYNASMQLWLQTTGALDLQCQYLKYENLIEDPKSSTAQVAAFLEIEWSDSMLASARDKSGTHRVLTPSYRQISGPLTRESIGRWRLYKAYFKESMGMLDYWIRHFAYDDYTDNPNENGTKLHDAKMRL